MLKALIRKQYLELFKSYFVNRKTGQPRTKAKTTLLFIGFAVLMAYLVAMFGGLAYLMGSTLISAGFSALYFALMGTLSCILGVFGSVFNTYSGLYLAKDNDLLISMPIPPRTILASRLVSVAGMSLMYSGCVWLPAIVFYWLWAETVSAVSVIYGLLLTVFIALFVTVLSCLLGWLVALASKRLRNKSFITVIISLAVLGLYYSVCFRMNDIINNMVNNAGALEGSVKTWLNLMYQVGMAATGNTAGMLMFCGVTAALCAVCGIVLSRTFISLATGGNSVSGKKKLEKVSAPVSVRRALLGREFRRFGSSATYMLNCGLGAVLLPVMAVFALIKKDTLAMTVEQLSAMVSGVDALVPMFIACAVCMVLSMDMITTPSVSLEGKTLWLLKSLPVSSKDVLRAKIYMHLIVNVPVGIVSAVILCVALNVGLWGACAVVLSAVAVSLLSAASGLALGIARPDFNWTSEQAVIKQSMNTLISLFGSWVLVIAIGAGGWFLKSAINPVLWLFICDIIMLTAGLLLTKWLDTKGAHRFETL